MNKRFIRRPVADRFWEKVERKSDDECWEWQASRTKHGYGKLTLQPGQLGVVGHARWLHAHRIAWMLTNETVDDPAICVLHECDNPPCCNPKHLFIGTQLDNIDDCVEKKRNHSSKVAFHGTANAMSELSATDVAQIKDLRPYCTLAELGDMFGVSFQHISSIVRGTRRSVA